MTLTLSISWWVIPTIITVCAFIFPMIFVRESGIGASFVVIGYWAVGFFIAIIFWIIFAILK